MYTDVQREQGTRPCQHGGDTRLQAPEHTGSHRRGPSHGGRAPSEQR